MIPNPLNLPDEGDTLPAAGFEIILERRRVADLVLPTGKLVACDPLTMPETEPFERVVPAGNYPVYAILASGRDHVRIAYAVIEFDEQHPHRWEIAQLAGEEPSRWNGERSAFQVESNVAGFMDNHTADVLMRLSQFDEEFEEFEKTVHRDIRKTGRGGSRAPTADVIIDPRNGGNVVAFDVDQGMYVTYFGHDGDDNVCMAVLDFEVLDYKFTPFGLRY